MLERSRSSHVPRRDWTLSLRSPRDEVRSTRGGKRSAVQRFNQVTVFAGSRRKPENIFPSARSDHLARRVENIFRLTPTSGKNGHLVEPLYGWPSRPRFAFSHFFASTHSLRSFHAAKCEKNAKRALRDRPIDTGFKGPLGPTRRGAPLLPVFSGGPQTTSCPSEKSPTTRAACPGRSQRSLKTGINLPALAPSSLENLARGRSVRGTFR